jgi:hypothetical protein
MSEREADLSSPSWCFSSDGVSGRRKNIASSQIGYIDVFQRVGVSRQRAGSKHTPEVVRGLPRKSVGTKRERGAFVGGVEPVAEVFPVWCVV